MEKLLIEALKMYLENAKLKIEKEKAMWEKEEPGPTRERELVACFAKFHFANEIINEIEQLKKLGDNHAN
jgi:hypothetical protein